MLSFRKKSSMNFELSYASKEITPWDGMIFLKQMLDKIGFKKHISNCEYLPKQNSNRRHSVQTIIESFTTSIWCGANKFLHTELTRSNIHYHLFRF